MIDVELFARSLEPDESVFFQYQTTKVRVLFIEEEGLIVLNRSKNHRLGIIPYCFLNTKNEEIREGRSLYVQYMGESMDGFLLFAEEEAVQTPADYERYYKEWLKKHLTSMVNNIVDEVFQEREQRLRERNIFFF